MTKQDINTILVLTDRVYLVEYNKTRLNII